MKVSFYDKSSPDVSNGMKVSYGPGKREASKWRWRLVVFVAVLPLIYFLGTVAYSYLILDVPGLVSMTSYTLKAPSSGVLVAKPFNVNDVFQEGEVVGHVRGQQIEERIELLQAEKDAIEGKDTHQGLLSGAELAVNSASALVKIKEEQVAVVAKMMRAGVATRAEYNDAANQLESAKIQLGQLEASLRVTRFDRKDLLSAEMAALKRREEARSSITATEGGTVIKRYVLPGQFVQEGEPIVDIADPTSAFFIAYFMPKNVSHVHVGDVVTLRLADGRKIPAKVVRMNIAAQKKPDEFASTLTAAKTTVPVKLESLEPVSDLVDGMPFSVRFGIALF